MSNAKLEATFHPDPAPSHECGVCDRRWSSADAARHCCGDWVELGED